MAKLHTLPLAALSLALFAVAPSAQAADAKNLDRTDARGYGDTTMRVGASYTLISGRGVIADAATGAPIVADYKRSQITLDMDVYGFWDATRFDSLIGAEFLMKLGLGGAEKFDGQPDRDGKLYFRSDFAFDYGVIHWDGDVRGRVSFGAGAGMDFGPRWYAASGRFYPQLVGRVQLWFGEVGLHASWHHLPTTSGDYTDREHRFEIAAGSGPIHGGVRYTLTRILKPAGQPDDLSQKEMGVFVMGAF